MNKIKPHKDWHRYWAFLFSLSHSSYCLHLPSFTTLCWSLPHLYPTCISCWTAASYIINKSPPQFKMSQFELSTTPSTEGSHPSYLVAWATAQVSLCSLTPTPGDATSHYPSCLSTSLLPHYHYCHCLSIALKQLDNFWTVNF